MMIMTMIRIMIIIVMIMIMTTPSTTTITILINGHVLNTSSLQILNAERLIIRSVTFVQPLIPQA